MTEVKRPAPRPIHKESDQDLAPKAKSDKDSQFDNAPGYSDEQLAQIKSYYGK